MVVGRSEISNFSKTVASGPAVAAPAGHRRVVGGSDGAVAGRGILA